MRALAGLLLLLLAPSALGVKSGDFKTCSQSGFCRRGRALSARAYETGASWKSPYSVDPSSVSVSTGQAVLNAAVKSALYPDINFSLDIRVHDDGVVRVRMDEVGGLRKRYDEAASWALVSDPVISRDIVWKVHATSATASYGDGIKAKVEFSPLRISLSRNGKEEIVLNGEGLLHMEHFRHKVDPPPAAEGEDQAQQVLQANPAAWFEGDSEDAYWEERFNTWTDSKPKGPESLSLDINFPAHGHIYGIPQHATRLFLQDTKGENKVYDDPYRLYNADVFEYIASSPMSLYGSIPLLHAHSATSTVAIFNAIGSETWVDVEHREAGKGAKGTNTHWISESGILDIFLMPGPTPDAIFEQYTRLTGRPALPAQFALGYHQCRWNYISSDDIRGVQQRMDEDDFPVDVFWLDIEYAPDHKYFIWDNKGFPDPVEMVNDVAAIARKMVVIIDPHLKRTSDYPVYKQASDLEVLVKPASASGEFEGWCWSGSSSWVDFFNPKSWEWWKLLFKTTPRADGQWSWTESTDSIHIWNDMNEPSVFNGPEISMPRDNVHYGGWEHRDVHNINGMLFSNQTWQALLARSEPAQRPFVLTRSFFSGSQRFGAIWTGDNMGTWEHMAVGIPMVLSNSIGGMVFVGADVGGFFGDPEREMLTRWYVVGAFSPFFRAHAHIDTKRREPYLLDEPYKSIVRDVLRLRYSMLPVWYTAFREASVNGLPVVRPHYVVFPQDKNGFEIDDQYWIGGSGLLVKPVTQAGVKEVSMYLPDDQPYYDYFTHYIHRGSAKGTHAGVPAELHQIPLLIRGGSIIPTRERHRRSSALMKHDPFTLRIALDRTDCAKGELYLDDGESFAHRERGELLWREFDAAKERNTLRIANKDLVARSEGKGVVDGVVLAGNALSVQNAFAQEMEHVRVEKVVVLGLSATPKKVVVEGTDKELTFEWSKGANAFGKKEAVASVLTIKDPALSVAKEWVIVVHY